MNITEIQVALAEPFDYDDIEWRISRSGIRDGKPWARCLAYVTNRAIQQRLDDTVGIAGWRNEYCPAPDGGVLCGISLNIGNEWITKWDGAQNTKVESTKGGLSGAMKRAAVQWGIGRYLYSLEEDWADCHADASGEHRVKFVDKATGQEMWGSWNPPTMPAWALPDNRVEHFFDVISRSDAYEYFLLTREFDDETMAALFNRFPKGEKTARKNECRELERQGAEHFNTIEQYIKAGIADDDALKVAECRLELTDREVKLLAQRLTKDEKKYIAHAVEEAQKEAA